jgi:N-carbamoylputrescine amidase
MNDGTRKGGQPYTMKSIHTAPGFRDLWQRAMLGHAVCNVIPVVAANRVGNEGGQEFYGSSFIANHRGEKLAELGRSEEGVIVASVDLDLVRTARSR